MRRRYLVALTVAPLVARCATAPTLATTPLHWLAQPSALQEQAARLLRQARAVAREVDALKPLGRAS
jgi:hypothetical protein